MYQVSPLSRFTPATYVLTFNECTSKKCVPKQVMATTAVLFSATISIIIRTVYNYTAYVVLGPMTEWNQAALVALQGSLKTNIKTIQLYDLLERPAGGFMDRAEVLSVKAKTGDMEQMGEVINILRGKEDAAFYTFCDLLRRSNYGVWSQELVSAAEGLKTEKGKFSIFSK